MALHDAEQPDDRELTGEDLEIEEVSELTPRPRLSRADDLWRSLRPGDQVRLKEVPREFLEPDYFLCPDTLEVYEHLVATGAVLTIKSVDPEDALPWTEYRWSRRGGPTEYHYLALNHGGIALVQGA